MCRLCGYLNLHLDRDVWHAVLDTALTACRRSGNLKGTAAALAYAGLTTAQVPARPGSLDDARRMHEESLGIFRRLGDRRDEARATMYHAETLALCSRSSGSEELAAQAMRQGRRAIELADAIGDEAIAVEALLCVAREHGELAQWPEMVTASERAYRYAAAAGAHQVTAASLYRLSVADRHLGRVEMARERLEEALRLVGDLGDRRGEAELLAERSRLEAATGDLDAAIALLDRAKALRSPLERRFHVRADLELGTLYLREDRASDAVHHLTRAADGAAAMAGGALQAECRARLDEALAAADRLPRSSGGAPPVSG